MANAMGSDDEQRFERHGLHEDAVAILFGTLLVSFGVSVCSHATLLVGGMAGLALLLQYATGFGFWVVFSLLNVPFYFLAWKRLGWRFAVRSFIAVSLLALLTRLTPLWLGFSRLDSGYAAVIGGITTGVGLLMLFRHRTGLGGINILALYLQERFGLRAGYVQLGLDLAILCAAFFVLAPQNIALSVGSATIVNLILAMNHKPGRYFGTS